MTAPVLEDSADGRLLFWCPGCDMVHGVSVGFGGGPRWGWNGDREKPTFTPSVRVTYIWGPKQQRRTCHLHVVGGRLMYLPDCWHALAGQSIDMPPFTWGD